jgi:hypothetical protein
MKKGGKDKKRKRKFTKLIPLTIKVTEEDAGNFRKRAKKFANGNVSAWLRHSGLKYVPKSGEAIKGYAAPKRS